MKKITFALCLIMLVKLVSGQDFIIKKNGDEIKAKVSEITPTEIKFAKVDNPGVTYSIAKTEVFMIKYANGSKDVFNEQVAPSPVQQPNEPKTVNSKTMVSIGEELTYSGGRVLKENRKLKPYEVKNTMVSNSAALGQYKTSRTYNTLGWICTSAAFVELGLGLATTAIGGDGTPSYIFAILDSGVGLAFSLISNSKAEKSVSTFNAGLKKQTSFNLNLGITPNGVGLCLKF